MYMYNNYVIHVFFPYALCKTADHVFEYLLSGLSLNRYYTVIYLCAILGR